jgi:cysteine desulfurase
MFQFHADPLIVILNDYSYPLGKLPIYLDYLSTTPCDPEVVKAMLPFFSDAFGNAASHTHSYGWQSAEAVLQAREQVAALIGSEPSEVIFTSGATESDNLGLKGIFSRFRSRGDHIITCQTEHRAVLDSCNHISRMGGVVSYLPVNEQGLISLSGLEQAFTPRTILVCIMYANNETGVIQPIREIAAACRKRKVLFMCDASQAVGKIPVSVTADGIDLMAFTAHKIYGPKGIGALYIRRKNPRVTLEPQMDGGGHENGFRSGTLNVPAIIGFGKACQLCAQALATDAAYLRSLRDRFESILTEMNEIRVNGTVSQRLAHVSNLAFEGTSSSRMLSVLAGDIAVSSGSACTSARPGPSHVLKAMGLSDERATSSLRFSFGRPTLPGDILYATEKISAAFRLISAPPDSR